MKFSVLLAGAATAVLMVSGAHAADLILPTIAPVPVFDETVFGFEGFYAGFQGGVLGPNQDGEGSFGLVGVVAGVNFAVTDTFIAGIEGQVNGYFGDEPESEMDPGDDDDDNGFYATDFLVQGKLGAMVTDEVMVYGLAGVGFAQGHFGDGQDTQGEDLADDNVYGTVGVGVQVAVTDSISIRGEAALIHNFEGGTELGDDEIGSDDDFDQNAGKFTVGVIFGF